MSPVRVTVTGIFTVFSVSSPVHVIPLGVPVTFPSGVTLKPFVGVEVIFASGLFAVTTGVSPLVYSRPSIAFVLGFAGVAVNGVAVFGVESFASGIPSLSSSSSTLSAIPS